MKIADTNIAVVSGGAGYLGQAIVKEFAERGFTVVVISRGSHNEELMTFLASLPGTHHAYVCDLGNREMLASTLDLIETEVGMISVFVHAAGEKPRRKKIIATTSEDLAKQYGGTIVPAFNFLTLSALKLKANKSGTLIGVTTAGVVLSPAATSLGAYIPAKYAVQGMLTMLRDELSSFGVRVYSVAPGFMAGGMNDDIPTAFVEMLREKSKTKNLLTRENVATRIVDICLNINVTSETFTSIMAPEYD